MVLGSTDGFSGVGDEVTSFVPMTVPTFVPKASSIKLIPSAPASGGLFSNLIKGIGNVGNWFSQNSGNVVQVLDAAGRLKQGAKAQADLVNDAYYRNILNTPAPSWFEQESIPGLKNSMALMLVAVVVGGYVFMSRKGAQQVHP
jgi:hypothetical protein